jgi:hypothetical protein
MNAPDLMVANTQRAGTAQLVQAMRLGVPYGDESDIRARGVVDFQDERLWLKETFVTSRIAAERAKSGGLLSRGINRVVHAGINRVVAGSGDVFYEGAARWKGASRGGWRGPNGQPSDPKDTWHPLFLFDALRRGVVQVKASEADGEVQGAATIRHEIVLTEANFDASTWERLAQVQSHPGSDRGEQKFRQSVRAFVWSDEKERIVRMSYEAVYSGDQSLTSWSITEFSDFGTPIQRSVPDEAG